MKRLPAEARLIATGMRLFFIGVSVTLGAQMRSRSKRAAC